MFFRNVFRTMFQCINPKTTDDSEAYGATSLPVPAEVVQVVESVDSESEPDYTICTLVEETVQGEAGDDELPFWFMDFVEDSEVVTSFEGQRDFMEYINDSDEEYEADSEDEESEADVSLNSAELEVADTLTNFADYDYARAQEDIAELGRFMDQEGSENQEEEEDSEDESGGIARVRVYTRDPRDGGLVDGFIVTSTAHPTDCNCGSTNCTVHIDRLLHILATAMGHSNDEDFFREISSISTDTSMLPTQKVTWSVEENTIDWDLKAMCLCGVRDCQLKFGSNPKRTLSNMYMVGPFLSKEHKERMEELDRKEKEMEEQVMRNFIGRLEKQRKQLEGQHIVQEQLVEQEPSVDPLTLKTIPCRPKPDFVPSPLTLWSGVPFARMDRDQLTKSCSELTELVKGGRFTVGLKWRQVYEAQMWAGQERKPGGFVDMLMKEAERAEDRLEHNEMMLQTAEYILNCSIVGL